MGYIFGQPWEGRREEKKANLVGWAGQTGCVKRWGPGTDQRAYSGMGWCKQEEGRNVRSRGNNGVLGMGDMRQGEGQKQQHACGDQVMTWAALEDTGGLSLTPHARRQSRSPRRETTETRLLSGTETQERCPPGPAGSETKGQSSSRKEGGWEWV